MLDLFRVEVENQTAILSSCLLELERGQGSQGQLETLMRAAHSLKGAARIVNLQVPVRIAHAMEDCFAAAQKGRHALSRATIDALLRGVDLLAHISRRTETNMADWEAQHAAEIQDFLGSFAKPATVHDEPQARPGSRTATDGEPASTDNSTQVARKQQAILADATKLDAVEGHTNALITHKSELPERVVRLTAETLNRLLGLAGESLVESRWLRPFADSLQRLKRRHADLSRQLDDLRDSFTEVSPPERVHAQVNELLHTLTDCQQQLADRIQELDTFDRHSSNVSHRLYLEVLRTRMRPFGDGVRRFPRMVRDLAKMLGKEVKLEIAGENTQVDRDILERLETPLAHLLRNAVDHGCASRTQRQLAGKPPEGTIRLEARHSAGLLVVTVTDDGEGVSPESLRKAIVQKKLAPSAVAGKLTEAELLEFLFLPGFTLKEAVTEISGRGVGLDVVQNMVKNVRGTIRISNRPGQGMRFQLQLPLTLSVLRALLVEVDGEPYAIPLTQIAQALKLERSKIETLEGRHHFNFGGQPVGLVSAHQVLECGEPRPPGDHLPIVVIGDRNTSYGLLVDRFLGQRELVVQPLDARLGKVKDISAAAQMEDGSPILILDVDDVVRSVEKLVSAGYLAGVQHSGIDLAVPKKKRVLAVDDSLTVRELERKLLTNRGYLADVAVDGMDGWNAVRSGDYDLVITDVDMPRMDGIELAAMIKKDPRLNSLPVLIVSYKDSEEDRMRGLEAGADYYLTKGSFHDETLLRAVSDLIGEPDS